jgi:hypothetical protein
MAASESGISRKVSGTEPDFVQKLGTEPNFERKKAERRALLCEFDPETYKTSAASDARMAALDHAEQCSALRENASFACLRLNHRFGEKYLPRDLNTFKSSFRNRNNEGVEGSEG